MRGPKGTLQIISLCFPSPFSSHSFSFSLLDTAFTFPHPYRGYLQATPVIREFMDAEAPSLPRLLPRPPPPCSLILPAPPDTNVLLPAEALFKRLVVCKTSPECLVEVEEEVVTEELLCDDFLLFMCLFSCFYCCMSWLTRRVRKGMTEGSRKGDDGTLQEVVALNCVKVSHERSECRHVLCMKSSCVSSRPR